MSEQLVSDKASYFHRGVIHSTHGQDQQETKP
jgi:hypothetical protein